MYFDNETEVKNNPYYSQMLQGMREEVASFIENYHDDPRFLSGWGHNYFCQEDGGRLIFNMKTPHSHECVVCGKVYTGFYYDCGYITNQRNEAIVTAVKSAVLYRLYGEEKYLDIVKNIIGFYADNYEYFAIHAKNVINASLTEDVGGAGKIMPQGLNEAIIGIRMISALELVKQSLEKSWLDNVKHMLFSPLVSLIIPQKNHIHNIPTWINSTIGVVGLFFNEQSWIDEAFKKPFNIYEQIEHGVTKSGFWYEGSIHYNFFALEGLMSLMLFAEAYNYPVEEKAKQTLFFMLQSAYQYAFDNDRFPNPSDGWPDVCLKTYSFVYYMAKKVFGDVMLPYIAHIESNPLPRTRIPLSETYYFNNEICMEQLLFASNWKEEVKSKCITKPPKRTSQLFEAYNCALLRSDDFNVFLKYGHQTRSHAHPDKMSIEVMVGNQMLIKDLSNSGYGSKLCNEWHRKIASHNTCVVNGCNSDLEKQGKLLQYDKGQVKASCEPYEGVVYTRTISLVDFGIADLFQVSCQNESTIDWFYHLEHELFCETLSLEDREQFESYPYFTDIKEVMIHGGKQELYSEVASIHLVLEEGSRLYVGKSPNNPANKSRTTIMVRKSGKDAIFEANIRSR